MCLPSAFLWYHSKSNAKTALTGKYATAYLVCLVTALISGVIPTIQNWVVKPLNMADFFSEPDSYRFTELGELMQRATISSSFSLANLLLSIFVVLPITVGVARFFVHNRFGDTKFETMFSGFRENYGNTVGAMFVTYLFVFLWALLFVIPGIIKALEYSMVEFLLSDNPSMPGERARQISSQMTSGEKGAIFVFCLSFLGWYLLGGIAVGFFNHFYGFLSIPASALVMSLVVAYQKAAMAELYIFMRDRAIRGGIVQPAELGLAGPAC